MRDVTSPAAVRALLKEKGLSPNKGLGQNFLCDAGIIRKIADASGVTKADAVLEIGPGLGALTRELCERAERVVAVEIDAGLAEVLKETLSDKGNATVLHADFLKCDLGALHRALGGGPFRVAANLPYYITSPCIMALLTARLNIRRITVMVQREVADRLCAAPGSKDYGVLTVAAGFFSAPQRLFNVSPSCFYPRPEVESAVVQMEIAPQQDMDFEAFMDTVKALFAMRRKTVKSNLRTAGLEPQQTEAVLKAAGIDENARAETLSVRDFIAISRELKKIY